MRKLELKDVRAEYLKYGYELLDNEYKGLNKRHKVKNKDGYIGLAALGNIRHGQNVEYFGTRNPYTIENIKTFIIINKLSSKFVKGYFTGSRDRNLTFLCNCGEEFIKSWNDFSYTQNTCSKCGLDRKYQSKPFEYKYVKEYIEKEDYSLISTEYNSCKSDITIQCNKNHIYITTFDNFKSGRRCPMCKHSKGEYKILQWLDNNNIEYIREYTFDNCKSIRKLRFDFYLPMQEILIEYDGEFHYNTKSSLRLSQRNELDEVKKRDAIKNSYCKDNKLKLYRIPYFEYKNIEKILKNIIYGNTEPSQLGNC